jgi:O-antigen ligase
MRLSSVTSPALARGRRYSGAIVSLLIVACSLLLGQVIGEGGLSALALLGLALLGVLVYLRPAAFVFFVFVPYAALNAVLRDIGVLSIGRLDLNGNQVVMVVLTGALVARILAGRVAGEYARPMTASHVLMFLFGFWSLFRFIATTDEEGSIIAFRLLCLAVIFLFGYLARNSDTPWVLATIGGAACVAGFSVAQDFLYPTPELRTVGVGFRYEGSFGGPVATAAAAVAGLPVFVYLWLSRRSWVLRGIALIGFAAIGFSFLFTLTRTTMLTFIVFSLCFLWSSRKIRTFSRAAVISTVAGLVLAMMLLLSLAPRDVLDHRISDMTDASGSLGTGRGSGRSTLWQTALAATFEAPVEYWLIGHGPGTTYDAIARGMGWYLDSHNSYLTILYDTGFIGLALYLAFLVGAGRTLATGLGAPSDDGLISRIWLSFLIAHAVSTLAFNGYAYAIGGNWLTVYGLGFAMQRATRSVATRVSRGPAS